MVRRSSLLVVVLLLAPAFALVPTAEACAAAGVPCGRIYPQITMRVPDQLPVYNVTQGTPLELDAELTFRFDMTAEGYTVPSPNDPIVVRFEFPRKPKWAELDVEPESITIPVHDPRYVQADPTAATPQAWFVYTTNIKITATVIDRAVLRDGYDYAKLLVFAKSTESGLYQAGYGIKEIRVAPEGALHESDLAGTRDVFTPSPLPALALEAAEATVAGVTVSLTPPASPAFWEPGTFDVAVSPAFEGRMMVALHDERGDLVAHAGPLDAADGRAAFNATLVRPGLHTATVALLPLPGQGVPITIPVDFLAGDVAAEGHEFPKAYVVSSTGTVPPPTGNRADALTQFEHDVPFFAFDTAQSVTATVTLTTPGLDALARSAANLQFSIHDPEGNLLGQKSVDPTKPMDGVRVGSLPSDGWYVVRLKGVGIPAGAAYTTKVEAVYAQPAIARNHADGVADATQGLLGLGGRNLTLPVEGLSLWAPSPLTPSVDGADSLRYTITLYDANATLVYATGLRTGVASFAAAAPGVYRALLFAEPVAPGTSFAPVVRAFTFGVGNASETTATTFSFEDTLDLAQAGVTPTLVGWYALPALASEGAFDLAAPASGSVEYVDAEGNTVDAPAKVGAERVFVRVLATRADGGAQSEASIAGTADYGAPVSLVGPDVAPTSVAPPQAAVPFLALGAILGMVGLAAVAVALARRP